jgi:hypothetical protein
MSTDGTPANGPGKAQPSGNSEYSPRIRGWTVHDDTLPAQSFSYDSQSHEPFPLAVFKLVDLVGGVQVVVFESSRPQTLCFRAFPVANACPSCYASAIPRVWTFA